MPRPDARALPLDDASASDLRSTGLEYALVEADGEGFDAFLSAVARGFLDPDPTPEQIDDSREALRTRRLTAVYDRDGARADEPVATIDSWVTELTTEPGSTLPLWAISAVTVAPTHRRRGIARALLTGELRTAARAGVAIAGLTVTEATIYGRWGFSPAVFTSDWTVDTARVRWSGPRPAGRLDFVDPAELPDRLGAVHERARLARPGQIAGWPGLWRRVAGLRPGAEEARKVRAVAYRDCSGAERGIVVYTIKEGDDFARATLEVRALVADGDEAYAALWRFALEHDLVGTVTASLQPVDAPLRWMIGDQRAARVSVTDHEWLRILDVPAALSARAYASPLGSTLRVVDPLGIADGSWRWEVDEHGRATVTDAAAAAAELEVEVGALGSLVLGGVAASTLATAGVVRGDEAALRALDAALTPRATPLLGIWY